MNWMTSAKNRFQRSNKSKNNNNLRMAASSKLPASRVRNSVVLHNFQPAPARNDERGTVSRIQSNDVWLLNNRSRDQKNSTRQTSALPGVQQSEMTAERRPAVPSDPLRHLEITPPKKWCEDAEELIEEQQITYYNDGHLCDELGNLLIDVSSNHASTGTRIAPKRRLFSPVSERTPPQTGLGSAGGAVSGEGVRESPELRLDSADGDDWWPRLLTMLDSGGMSHTHLHTVLAEVAATVASSDKEVCTAEQLAQVEPPTTREALNALYRALSKVGRDTRASLTVFDAIRMLELVDKQHSDHTISHTGGGIGTASTIRTTNTTALPVPPTQPAYTTTHPTTNNTNKTSHSTTNTTTQKTNNGYADDSEWNLFDAPISTDITTNKHHTIINTTNNMTTNTTNPTTTNTTICAKRKLSPTHTESTSTTRRINNNTGRSNAGSNVGPTSMYGSGNSGSIADMELRLEDVF